MGILQSPDTKEFVFWIVQFWGKGHNNLTSCPADTGRAVDVVIKTMAALY